MCGRETSRKWEQYPEPGLRLRIRKRGRENGRADLEG